MKKKNLHTYIKNAVKEYLQWSKWYVMEIQNGPFGTHGVSDLIAIRNGRTVFIEIKSPKGKLSNHQLKFGEEIGAHGGKYVIVNKIEDLP